MEGKYNTGYPIDLRKLSKEEAKAAMHEWAEGSPGLERLLKEGYEKGLLSMACCAGHGENGKPYIAYDLNDENSRKMAMDIAEKLVDSDLDCEVHFQNDFHQTEEEYSEIREHLIKNFPEDFSEENYSPTRTINRLNVQAKMENKEEVFETMADYVKEAELDNVKLPESKEEVPRKDFKKEHELQEDTKAEEKNHASQENTETKGKQLIEEAVELSEEMGIRQGEIGDSETEINRTEREYQQPEQDYHTRGNIRGE